MPGRQRAEGLVFLAMARFHLRQSREARAALAEARALLARESSEGLEALVLEAEELSDAPGSEEQR